MWRNWSTKLLNYNLIVNSHCAGRLAVCHCDSHLQNRLEREVQTSEPGCYRTWEHGGLSSGKREKTKQPPPTKKQTSKTRPQKPIKQKNSRERERALSADEHSFVGKYQRGSCKGKSCFINLLDWRWVTVTMWIKSDLYFPIAFDKAPHERS